MTTAAPGRPAGLADRFAPPTLASWAFALRVWLAMVLALYAAFWLELRSPASAALTTAILAVPARGQGLEKAVYRILATAAGVVAALSITAAFTQTEVLLLGAFAAWTGLCAYGAKLFDGNRAYAAALGAITVAFVAVQEIDTPGGVFDAGLARGAAIVVGILAVAFVNDVLAAPDYYPSVLAKLRELHGRVAAYARSAARGDRPDPVATAGLFAAITALRPEVSALATESSSGDARSAAARTAMVGLVFELCAARGLAILAAAVPAARRERVLAEVERGSSENGVAVSRAAGSGLAAAGYAWMATRVLERDLRTTEALDALACGESPKRMLKAPLYRSHRIALSSGVTSALQFALAALVLGLLGWPASDLCLTFVAIMLALASIAPDPRGFARIALLSAPLSCLLAGIIEFVILDGVSEFPQLALALAPVVIGLALAMTARSPALVAIARFSLIFTVALLGPSNPESYDPESFLVGCLFLFLAVALVFLGQYLVPPLDGRGRLDILLAEAHRDLRKPRRGGDVRLAREEVAFRDAMRMGQVAAAAGAGAEDRARVAEALGCLDQAAALRRAEDAWATPPAGVPAALADAARSALARRDAAAITAVARALDDAGSCVAADAAAAFATLVVAAATIVPNPAAAGREIAP